MTMGGLLGEHDDFEFELRGQVTGATTRFEWHDGR